jgi:hypothetical protein
MLNEPASSVKRKINSPRRREESEEKVKGVLRALRAFAVEHS